jgi:hypothetical protein
MKQNQRPPQVNQQIAKSVRPQLPRDGSKGGTNYHTNGKLPSGFTSVWRFDGVTDTKNSATTKPEKNCKVC